MLAGRKRSSGSFGTDGKRLEGKNAIVTTTKPRTTKTCEPASCHGTNKLFQPGAKLLVRRAPVICGLSVPAGLQKKFQRPMTKRRAYNKSADEALKRSSLGPKRRMDGMSKLMARAGRGLTYKLPRRGESGDGGSDDESDDERKEKENDRPFEPLLLWTSPHEGGEAIGLPPKPVTEMQNDEYGIEEEVTVMRPAPAEAYSKKNVFVPPVLAKWLRPHQREGVQFMYECVMGLKDFKGQGCILADDMGLGKTLQSVTLIYTLLKTSIVASGAPTAKRVIVICPCSLVKNWDNEFVKWLGPAGVKTMALAESDRKTVEKNLNAFVRTTVCNVLIASYETIRTHVKILNKSKDCCDLLVCDEAHRLKNSENQTSRALNSLPVKRRVLLTGTPMQNDLQEFYAMVDFTNPGILGTQEEFRKRMLFPILRGREPDATESQKRKMMEIQQGMSATVNEFILRRVNTLNAQHLPPKLVQVVCCNLTEIQQNMYQHLVTSKAMQHVLDGKQVNSLGSIQMLMKLCNHPRLIAEDQSADNKKPGRRAATKTTKYTDGDETTAAAPGADGISKFLPFEAGGGGRGMHTPVRPEWSGKMFVLYRLMKEMRKPGNGGDKIVIVSNYTQTLDLIGRMCRENSWGFCRLDGSITMKKRQKMVDEFNDPSSSLIAFLLSSKAGGCGLNLIGGNRLVLFDPDWNPAVDKQAAARCWRDGQKKRCFTYRFLATGTVEEKIYQRQLSKEGLQSVVDDKEQVNALSTKDLRNLFKLRTGTPSDTHDKLRCERCKIIADHTEVEAMKVLPKKLEACCELLTRIEQQEDAAPFLKPLVPDEHGVSKEEYEKNVKQPMDLSTIRSRLNLAPDATAAYKNVSGFSKDVNRIFSNVMKVWSPGDEIADTARRLQAWWVDEWTALVPVLMNMKLEDEKPAAVDDSPMEGDDDAPIGTCLNERGEDFQEQIGMPDEENMRSWSHHYSTDTVDDPVFRAAMRGTDAVSFVFGLEVTWDLIQQRQQEEEDRKALEELEEDEEALLALQAQHDEEARAAGEQESGKTPSKAKDDSASETEDETEEDTPEPPKKRVKTKPVKDKSATKSGNDEQEEDSSDENDVDDGEMDDFIVNDEENDGENDDESGSGSDSEPDADDDDSDDDDDQSMGEPGDDAPSPAAVASSEQQDEAMEEEGVATSSPSSSSSSEESKSQSSQEEDDNMNVAETATHDESNETFQSTSSDSSSSSSDEGTQEEEDESMVEETVSPTRQNTADPSPSASESSSPEDDNGENMDEDNTVSSTGVVVLKKGEWQCQFCTSINSNSRARKCTTCEQVRFL